MSLQKTPSAFFSSADMWMICEQMTVEAMNAELLRLRRTLPEVISEEIRGKRAAVLGG